MKIIQIQTYAKVHSNIHCFNNNNLVQCRLYFRDGPWPDPNILLTHSKLRGWHFFPKQDLLQSKNVKIPRCLSFRYDLLKNSPARFVGERNLIVLNMNIEALKKKIVSMPSFFDCFKSCVLLSAILRSM